ncbi:acyl carrier protein [Spirochaetia bacterium]|nr:acyl carrier protein [Spirochaetia bacterium]
MTRDDIFARLKDILASEFEIDSDVIKPEAKLYEELDLDSIDAVDLIVKMKEHIPGKIDPALFKTARTVQDVVELLYPLVQAAP